MQSPTQSQWRPTRPRVDRPSVYYHQSRGSLIRVPSRIFREHAWVRLDIRIDRITHALLKDAENHRHSEKSDLPTHIADKFCAILKTRTERSFGGTIRIASFLRNDPDATARRDPVCLAEERGTSVAERKSPHVADVASVAENHPGDAGVLLVRGTIGGAGGDPAPPRDTSVNRHPVGIGRSSRRDPVPGTGRGPSWRHGFPSVGARPGQFGVRAERGSRRPFGDVRARRTGRRRRWRWGLTRSGRDRRGVARRARNHRRHEPHDLDPGDVGPAPATAGPPAHATLGTRVAQPQVPLAARPVGSRVQDRREPVAVPPGPRLLHLQLLQRRQRQARPLLRLADRQPEHLPAPLRLREDLQ